jgi:hypothetical protein
MIHILYRHTEHTSGIGKNRPSWFSYDTCLNNILNTIAGNENITFHLIYDGKCNIKDSRIHQIVEFVGGSDKASFFYTWEYAKKLNLGNRDLVYFLENDYLHVSGWYEKIIDLYNSFDIPGYVSLYDHMDKYTLPMYNDLQSQIYVTNSSHWRTVPSTCGSFIVNKQILEDDYDIHTSFCSDHDKFIYLYQTRNRIVISPMPGLATHCESEYMTPLINWTNVNSNTKS